MAHDSNNDPAPETAAPLRYDKEVNLATASSRMAKKWANKSMLVSELVQKLSITTRTQENVEEFKELPKNERDNLKDIGAFVGGMLKGGNRSKDSVANRSFITLDIDYGNTKTLEVIKQKVQFAFTIYSTHSHAPKNPRYRLLIWPDRVMTADEYQPIARRMADKVGIEWFDDSSYESNRLFYWPSTPADGDYVFFHQDAPFLPVDKVLNAYGGDDAWKDVGLWPRSSRETKSFDRMMSKQANPLEKKGIVGALCRNISMRDALKDHLSDVYKFEGGDRYTYVEGTSTKGLVVYGELCFSNHNSDIAGGQCLNSFDLLRLHKFGDLDKDQGPEITTSKLPSYKEMIEWARGVDGVKIDLVKSGIDIGLEDFDSFGVNEEGKEWFSELKTDNAGTIKTTYVNAAVIIENDPKTTGTIQHNKFSQSIEIIDKTTGKAREWDNLDSLRLREYIDKTYNTDFPPQKVEDAITFVGDAHSYHPVREYLEGLEWDGVRRIETMLIDYMGAEDNAYTREAALCLMSAAVHRVFQPGFKFDTCIVLGGAQGIGKTTFIRELGLRKWYGTLTSFDSQKAMEQIAGKWIIEITELSAVNKSELEQQKSFLSDQFTKVRLSYDRRATVFERQQVFFGSTNRDEFLKDSTGNRRWWPVWCNVKDLDYKKLRSEVDQLWAEAYGVLWVQGKSACLSEAAQRIAFDEQEDKRESDVWGGRINEWLRTQAPKDRYDTKLGSFNENDVAPRDKVCISEVWEDCLGMNPQQQIKRMDQMRISAILDSESEWERPKWKRSFGIRFGKQKAWENKELAEIAKQNIPF